MEMFRTVALPGVERVAEPDAEPQVGLIGLFGGRDIPAHTWSETADRYGRSMTPTIAIHHSRGAHEVEVVDGALSFTFAPVS